jgi:hypothetical protein
MQNKSNHLKWNILPFGKPTYWIITRTNQSHAMPTPGNSFGANTPKNYITLSL